MNTKIIYNKAEKNTENTLKTKKFLALVVGENCDMFLH